MTDQDAVPPGYKRTEVGVIPEDWVTKNIGSFAYCTAGGTPSTQSNDYWGGTIRWMNSGELNLKIVHDVEGRITKNGLDNSSTKLIPSRCVLIGLAGQGKTRGTVAMNMVELCTNQSIAAILPNSSYYVNYLYYNLDNRYHELRSMSTGDGGRGGLNLHIIRSIVVPFPPLPEQHAIAAALSDVDGLIGALDALIAKKRDMKQAAMQQLLTGRTRLPGFEGEWLTVKVGALGTFTKGRGIKRDDVSDTGLACIRYGELYTTYKNYIRSPVSRIPPSVASDALQIKHGDLLFAGSGETAEEIGQCAAYIGPEQAYAGGDIIVFTPEGMNPIYLGHLMNHESVTIQKARMAQGDAIVHISTRSLSQIEVELPSIDEQLAISKLLLDMDAEITALERRRDKVKEIKQGMMQQLLTGKIRLIMSNHQGCKVNV
ncbi:restriction endonuclease subunit S [Methanocalculus taiwanensis]|uniref:restriction endonuclease subunit S n=1 Tax=Methanocalculus taiwanensis TaxID=106207 RepID=UPI0021014B6E|nr:restriction endonuclease subunit S [Methanocalculus taiwanensis]